MFRRLLVVAFVSSPAIAGAGSIPLYQIQNVAGGGCVDIMRADRSVGMPAHQWTCGGGAAQHFRIYRSGPGFALENNNSALCLEVPFASRLPSARVSQVECTPEANRRVTLTPGESGAFEIKFVHSALCMTVADAEQRNGATILQMPCDGSSNQRFYITNSSTKVALDPQTVE